MSGAGCESAIRSFFAEAGRSPRVAFTVRDMGTSFEMVRQRHGVTVAPKLSLPDNRAGLRNLPLSPACRRTLLAVMKADRTLLPATDAFRRDLHPANPASAPERRGRAFFQNAVTADMNEKCKTGLEPVPFSGA